MRSTHQPTLVIQDILVVANAAGDAGEFSDAEKDNEPDDALLDRLYQHIEELAAFATKQHCMLNCIPNSNELKPDCKNHITRLCSNEFYFYTRKPLSLGQIEFLCNNKLLPLANQLPNNLRLALGTFAVRAPENKMMNVVIRMECGKNPSFNFIVKTNNTPDDPVYKEIDKEGNIIPLLYVKNLSDISDCKIKIGDHDQGFSFNNVIAGKNEGELPHLECIDICLDNSRNVAKKNLNKIFLPLLKNANENPGLWLFPTLYTHLVLSNTLFLYNENCLGLTTHADPRHSQKSCKMGVPTVKKSFKEFTGKESHFGTAQSIYMTNPVPLDTLHLLTRPAYLAVKHGLSNVLIIFLQEGLDPNMMAAGTKSKNLISAALRYHQPHIIKLLLEHGASPSSTSKEGLNSLHFSAKYNHIDIFNLSIKNGGNLYSQDNDGCTPYYLAVLHKHNEIIQAIESLEFDVNKLCGSLQETQLHIAVNLKHLHMAEFLLEKGADPNIKDKYGFTPLHKAIQSGQDDMIKLLIRHGMDLNIVDGGGQTPLHYAAASGNIQACVILINAGADVNIGDRFGTTALKRIRDVASKKKSHYQIAVLIAEKMLQNAANHAKKNKNDPGAKRALEVATAELAAARINLNRYDSLDKPNVNVDYVLRRRGGTNLRFHHQIDTMTDQDNQEEPSQGGPAITKPKK